MVVCPFAHSPANTRQTEALRSVASTLLPVRGVPPFT